MAVDGDKSVAEDVIIESPARSYYIDWLRLLAVLLLFFFHAARVFDPRENFYVQNNPLSEVLYDTFIRSLGPWHMALFFLLAGASTYYALHHRTGKQYVSERFKRLFIPFIFGVLVLIPPQSYLGLLNHSNYSESFFHWFPDFFTLQSDDIDGYFMGGHTWGHLWFIIHLFIYSLIALPLFSYLNGLKGRDIINRIAAVFIKPGVLFLFPVWIVVANEFPEVAGGNPLFYITFFICGFILMADPRFMNVIDRQRIILLVIGPAVFIGILIAVGTGVWPEDLPGWADDLVDWYFDGFAPWFIILTMLSYGRQFLMFTNKALRYFTESAYPLYILHQTSIIVVGFYVVKWDISVAAKYSFIVFASFISCMLVYDVLVKRTNITRFLFGMKRKREKSAVK